MTRAGWGRREFLQSAAIAGGICGNGSSPPSAPDPVLAQENARAIGPIGATMRMVLTVNERQFSIEIDPRTSLLDALREHIGLTGAKKGCDHGQCGACTVLLNGRRINACLTVAVMFEGDTITTVEGLETPDGLHPMQAAFIHHDGFQCGYCTPGQICSAAGLIAEGKATSADEIRELMSGNICCCGAYPNIVAAIQQAMGQS